MTERECPVARIQGVTHVYKKVHAVDDVTLEIPSGQMVGLLGPDGVGKSTLMGLISGARKLQRGGLEVLGGDMASAAHRKAVGPRIAYMPQGLGKNLYAELSVAENLDFFGKLFGQGPAERKSRIDRLTKATGLQAFLARPAGKLSGGMKQKLGLCCSLIHDPDLLILDEPTTGVDPLSRRQFWALIATIRGERPSMSVLVSTAYMDEARLCDRIALIQDGTILKIDRPQEIIDTFPTKIYNVKAMETYKLLRDLEHYPDVHSVYPFGEFSHFTSKDRGFSPSDLILYLEKKQHSGIEVSETVATIEDAFMELSKENELIDNG